MRRDASHVIAVDIGTSAVRAALVSSAGKTINSTRRVRSTDLGGELFDAEVLWDDVRATILSLNIAADTNIEVVSISAHIGSVAVDDALMPVVPGGGWADARGLDRLNAEDQTLTAQMLRSSGRPVASSSALALALYLNAQGLGDRVHLLLSPKDYIIARLTGQLFTDCVDAAYTLAYDIRSGSWQTDELARLGVSSSVFPPPVPPSEIIGEVIPEVAYECGLPPQTPVIAGGPDGSVGMGLLLGNDDKSIADIAGTTDVLGMLVDNLKDQPSATILNPSIVHGRWTAGGSTGLTGGAVADWRTLVGAVEEQELSRIAAGCDGLRVLPAMSGERFPRWNSATRSAVLGRGADHSPAHLIRAAQEAACFTVREGIDVLDPSRQRPIKIAGGSVRSRAVAQMRADAFGRCLLVANDPDVTLLGAAGLGLIAAGLVGDLDEAREKMGVCFSAVEPAADGAAMYDEVYDDWLTARDTTADFDSQRLKAG